MEFLTGILAALVGLASLGGVYERDYIKYNYNRARDNSVYTQEFPITIPQELPSTKEIAEDIFKVVNPTQFLFGGSTSEHQCSTKCTADICTFSHYAQRKNLITPSDSRYRMNWWDNFKNYIDDSVSQLGMRDIRFSIEWSLVQPKNENEWDEGALQHYADLFKYCLKKRVAPLVCFHHYTDPNWFFFDKKAFTKEKNVNYFADYCAKVYEFIMQEVSKDSEAIQALNEMDHEPLWATFNAPAGYAFRTHREQPIDEALKGLDVVTEVVKNTCEATVQVSKKLKALFVEKGFEGSKPKVGFLKNGLQVDGAEGYTRPISNFFGGHADFIRHHAVYEFFTTGKFRVQIPKAVNITYENKDAVGSIDFIGLNYYSNVKLRLTKKVPANNEEDRKTDGDYHKYPEGMYRAIAELHEKMVKPYEQKTGQKLKMFIAENGIATKDTKKRDRFYREHLYTIAKAVQDGYPVEGYLPWTLFDNYEWPKDKNSSDRQYGIFSVTEDGEHLELKEGSKPLAEFGSELATVLSKR